MQTDLKGTPSKNPEQEENDTLNDDEKGMAQLKHNGQQVALLIRQDENPSPRLSKEHCWRVNDDRCGRASSH